MITFMIICAIIAAVAPIWLILDVEQQIEYDEDGELTEDSIPLSKAITASVMGLATVSFIFISAMTINFMDQPKINTAHRMKDLQYQQIYKILQKWEHHWRTYYYVEHANGQGGLYWCKTGDFNLDIGYYKLESQYEYKEMKFTPLAIKYVIPRRMNNRAT